QTMLLYAVWESFGPLVTLCGAGPLAQATTAGIARGVAAGWAKRFGRLGRRDPRRAIRLGMTLAAIGATILGLFGAAFWWVPGGSGFMIWEVGLLGAGTGLKGRNASGRDSVRKLLAANVVRFTGQASMQLILFVIGFYLSKQVGQMRTGRLLAFGMIVIA